MLIFFNQIKSNYFLLSLLFLLIAIWYIGGFIVSAALFSLIALFLKEEKQLIYLLGAFILIFIFADNNKGALVFTQNLRFIVLGLSIILLLRYHLLSSNPGNIFIPFSLYALIIAMVYSPVGSPSVLRSMGFWLVAMVIFKIMQLLLDFERRYTVNFILTVLSTFIFINTLLYFVPLYADLYSAGRYSGLMANPNGLGLLCMFIYALLIFMKNYEQHSYSKNFFLLLFFMILFLIIVTGSRTALVGVLAFEFFIRIRKSPVFLVFSFLVFAAGNIVINHTNVAQFSSQTEVSSRLRVESLETASGRTVVWKVAFEEFKQNPWLGKGMMYDDYFIKEYSDRYIGENKARHWNGVWNSYLSMGLNVGIIGLLLFGYAWYCLYKMSTFPIFRFAFMVMILLSAVTESWMAASMNAFMPLVFIIWALQIYPPEEEEEMEHLME